MDRASQSYLQKVSNCYSGTASGPTITRRPICSICQTKGNASGITELERLWEMQAALARERELFAQQRAAQLAKANQALRGCLDAFASVSDLDDFLGQVMAATTRQLNASSSDLFLRRQMIQGPTICRWKRSRIFCGSRRKQSAIRSAMPIQRPSR
jgi:hypothetical protein